MTASTSTMQIDLTAEGATATCVEVLTEAGIVRVSTGLVNTRDRRPVVEVEVEPNLSDYGVIKTPAGGHWVTESQYRHDGRVDVRMTKDG